MEKADLPSWSDCRARVPTVLHACHLVEPHMRQKYPLDLRHLAETEAVISFVVWIWQGYRIRNADALFVALFTLVLTESGMLSGHEGFLLPDSRGFDLRIECECIVFCLSFQIVF